MSVLNPRTPCADAGTCGTATAALPDTSALGGKAHGLRRLQAAGCRVPRFSVVSAGCFAAALGEGAARLRAALDGDNTNSALCAAQAAAVAAVLDEPPLATQLRSAIAAALAGKLSSRRCYAVRSSAVDEDSVRASFAGQLETRLNVPASEVVEAVLGVWRSAFAARALAYRAQRQLRCDERICAVIVQEMVAAETAGVLFTRGPDDADEMVVCAAYGLGEGVVDNRVEVDTYRIERASGAITRQIACKRERVVAAARGTRIVPVAVPAEDLPALDDRALSELRALGLRLETLFGLPLDVEFALDRWGRVHVLQARPITAVAQARQSVRVWDNSNVVESYPGLTLPLTFSFAQLGYTAAFAPYMKRRTMAHFPFRDPLRERREVFQNLIGLVNGRVYYNLLNWYEMMSALPGFARVRASWDRMIGVSGHAQARAHRLGWVPRQLAWAYCLWRLLCIRGPVKRFTRRFARVYALFAALDYAGLGAEALISRFDALKRALAEDWSLTLDNDFAAMAYFEALHSLCRRWGGRQPAALANALLRRAPAMESAEPVRALELLAARVRRDASLAALFACADDERILAALRATPAHREFAEAVDAYLQAYGDRCLEELKLEQPTFREYPAALVRTIREQLASPQESPDGDAAVSPDVLLRRIRNPLRRALVRWVSRRAQYALASRENMRFARARVFGIARRIFGELGRCFVAQGILPGPEDIHYLTIDEVSGCVRGTGVTHNLTALIALRREEYAAAAAQRPPRRLCTCGIPRWRGQPQHSDEIAPGTSARGTPCAGGRANGVARIVRDPRQSLPAGAHILVAEATDPGWVFLMARSAGIVVERGSVLSHTAIIGRELGIPTVVGVEQATRRIPDGAHLSIDGTTGRIQWQSNDSPGARN
jgi:phosphohistidine swiveling domain-containing protein